VGYPLVGGMRSRRFAGTSLEPRKLLACTLPPRPLDCTVLAHSVSIRPGQAGPDGTGQAQVKTRRLLPACPDARLPR